MISVAIDLAGPQAKSLPLHPPLSSCSFHRSCGILVCRCRSCCAMRFDPGLLPSRASTRTGIAQHGSIYHCTGDLSDSPTTCAPLTPPAPAVCSHCASRSSGRQCTCRGCLRALRASARMMGTMAARRNDTMYAASALLPASVELVLTPSRRVHSAPYTSLPLLLLLQSSRSASPVDEDRDGSPAASAAGARATRSKRKRAGETEDDQASAPDAGKKGDAK